MKDDKHDGRPLPPPEKRWKKGESGNPLGRPKKKQGLTSLLNQELEKVCPADSEKRTWKELIALLGVQHALKGNVLLLREIFDRMEGRLVELPPSENDRPVRPRIKPFDPNEPVEFSLETTNAVRAIYGLEPYTSVQE